MVKATAESIEVHSAPLPPRPLSSQARADELLMRWRLARAAGIPASRRLEEQPTS
jgi:hypothetical protein